MAYFKLPALDVDGTLIGPDQVVTRGVREAVAEICRAGLRVCLATGRTYAEALDVWRQLDLEAPFEPIVLVGGALVGEPDTGRTLAQRPIPLPAAGEFADALNDLGYVAMVLVDPWRHGVEYLRTRRGDQRAAQRGWFSKMDVRVRAVGRLAEEADLPEPLRISTVVDPEDAGAIAADLARRFEGRLIVQPLQAPKYDATIVEAHAAGATKLAALRYVAQARRIRSERIAAVGDDLNDLEMVRGVGLGVAMPHAPEPLRGAADHVAAEGLAPFLHRLAAGAFDPPGG